MGPVDSTKSPPPPGDGTFRVAGHVVAFTREIRVPGQTERAKAANESADLAVTSPDGEVTRGRWAALLSAV